MEDRKVFYSHSGSELHIFIQCNICNVTFFVSRRLTEDRDVKEHECPFCIRRNEIKLTMWDK